MQLDDKAHALANQWFLSARERDFLIFYVQNPGKIGKEIGDHFGVAHKTVKYHFTNIFKKCGVKNKGELIGRVIEQPLI